MSPGLLRASLPRGWQHTGPSLMSRVAVTVCLHTGAAPAPQPPRFVVPSASLLPGLHPSSVTLQRGPQVSLKSLLEL